MSKVTSVFVIASGAFMANGNMVLPGSKVELSPSDAYGLINRGKAKLVEGQNLGGGSDADNDFDDKGPTKEQIIAHLKTLNKGPLVQFAKDNDIEIDDSKNKEIILATVIEAVNNFKDDDEENHDDQE